MTRKSQILQKKDLLVANKGQKLSDEDKQLHENLETLLRLLHESDATFYMFTSEMMAKLIRVSITSMTSIPKPLKFRRPPY